MSSTSLRLLEVTRRLVAERGAQITMTDVAREAGVSRQAVYLHFSSRASLLLAVVRHIDDEDGILSRSRRALGHTDPVQALEAFVVEWLRYVERIHPVASALLAARDDPDVTAAWDDRMAELRAGFRHAAQRLADAGRLRAGLDPEAATDLAWAMTSVPMWELLRTDRGRAATDVQRLLVDAVTSAVTDGRP